MGTLRLLVHLLRPSFWRTERERRKQHRAMLAFYAKFVKKGDLCFDVGANVGNRTAVFADIGARVIAVEPQEACVAVLQKRFGRTPTVTVLKTALGEKPGTQEMLMSEV